ncbi:MAG: hypothetical protein QOG77_2490 [Solirubrobacteraceae bacterium]|jgi:hypothetical protein|nr:hypothetical protein [Solirubrobacteraceae bacterium]
MASGGKKKTTMAKMQRENKVRERRAIKKHRKEARKLETASQPGGMIIGPPNDVGIDFSEDLPAES